MDDARLGGMVLVLRDWRKVRAAERQAWGVTYVDTDCVFTAENGDRLHADHLAQRFERLVAAAGVPAHPVPHLRHTHATLLLKAGVPPHVVAQRLGHASPALTLSIYSHVLPRQRAAAAAAFAKLVDEGPRCDDCGEPLDGEGPRCDQCRSDE